MERRTEIQIAGKDRPLLYTKEPGFRKFFANGFLVQVSPKLVRVSPYDEAIAVDLEDGPEGEKRQSVGYHLEAQILTDWEGALKLRDLLDHHIQEHEQAHGPIEIKRKGSAPKSE